MPERRGLRGRGQYLQLPLPPSMDRYVPRDESVGQAGARIGHQRQAVLEVGTFHQGLRVRSLCWPPAFSCVHLKKCVHRYFLAWLWTQHCASCRGSCERRASLTDSGVNLGKAAHCLGHSRCLINVWEERNMLKCKDIHVFIKHTNDSYQYVR